MVHDCVDTGLVFSANDADRMRLLLDNISEPEDQLDSGIQVGLCIASNFTPIPRISLRVLDADMYQTQCHPIQLTDAQLTAFMDSSDCSKHVRDIVENKLCTNASVSLNSKGTTALQYITRQNLATSDTRFNHKVKDNLVTFIAKHFFNKAYIVRVMAYRETVYPST
jgi:hypothetical protein